MPFIPITPNFFETSIGISNKLHELDIKSYFVFENCYFEMENLYFNFEYESSYLNFEINCSILKSDFQLCKLLHKFNI
jgi:hypothetical protein